MRTLCDVCEAAPATLFCAADEAALCKACDDKVHGCNKLASRHVRLELAESRAVPRCDICENAPAFFYCGIDGTSLCLQCDMDVHIGGKKTHERYLLMGQRVELPKNKEGPAGATQQGENLNSNQMDDDDDQLMSNTPAVAIAVGDIGRDDVSGQEAPAKQLDLNQGPSQEARQEGDEVEPMDEEEDNDFKKKEV